MRKVVLSIFFVSILTVTMSDNQVEVSSGNSKFANKIYDIISKDDGNIVFSPLSIHAALSMAYQGSEGSTADALSKSLQVPEIKATAEGYESIMNQINSIENVTLLMANKVYLKTGQTLLDNFKNAVTKNFQSEVELVDFAKSVESATIINDWVKGKTNDKIVDLISPDVLNDLTRLVLVNAIYFKGDWEHKFDSTRTKDEPFYLDETNKVDVPMMHLKEKFNYKENSDLGAQILELPYKNKDVSMIILLPFEKNGIKDLEKKLVNVDLLTLTEGMWQSDVRVSLPKFKIELGLDLEETLKKVGLGEIFDQKKANFRGIIQLQAAENLYVSKVVHKAFIEVNEEGAEAAAATDVVWLERIARLEFPFTANHPFIVQLIHKSPQSKNVLFYGRINNPL